MALLRIYPVSTLFAFWRPFLFGLTPFYCAYLARILNKFILMLLTCLFSLVKTYLVASFCCLVIILVKVSFSSIR